MNRLALGLLGSTCLTALSVASAQSAAIVESSVGGFGTTFAGATELSPDVTEIFGDVPHSSEGGSIAYFRYLGYDSAQAFTIRLTTSHLTVGKSASEGGSEGGSIIVEGLTPQIFGEPIYLANSEGLSLTLATSEGASEGSSEGGSDFSAILASLAPILTFYDDAGQVLDQLRLDDGNSFELLGSGLSGGALNFSVDFDYAFVVEANVPTLEAVPEPGGATLVAAGLTGLAGWAAMRRGRRRKPGSA